MGFKFLINKDHEFVYTESKNNNNNKDDSLVLSAPIRGAKRVVAFFDLDYTLIKPKSGRKFPKDKDDYIFMFDNVIEILNQYIDNNYHIFMISNQSGLLKEKNLQKYEDMKYKLNKIFEDIENKEAITIFLACSENYYRKPHSGAFHFYESLYNVKINKKLSFFCGDALGRKDDFSASDYYFALNNDLKVYTPESIFKNSNKKNQYILDIKRPFLENAISNKYKKEFDHLLDSIDSIDAQKLIIMNGSPASGKSTFTSYMCKHYDFICCESDVLKTKLEKSVEKELINGKNIIVDSTNATKTHRQKYIDIISKIDSKINIICVYIPYNEELIHHLQHYRIEKSRGLTYALPEIALRVYKSKYEKPVKSEGFDYLFEYNPYFTFSNKSDESDFMKYY